MNYNVYKVGTTGTMDVFHYTDSSGKERTLKFPIQWRMTEWEVKDYINKKVNGKRNKV